MAIIGNIPYFQTNPCVECFRCNGVVLCWPGSSPPLWKLLCIYDIVFALMCKCHVLLCILIIHIIDLSKHKAFCVVELDWKAMHTHRFRRNAHSWLWHTTHVWALSCGTKPWYKSCLGFSSAKLRNLGISLVVHPYQNPIYVVDICRTFDVCPLLHFTFILGNVGYAHLIWYPGLGLGKSHLISPELTPTRDHPLLAMNSLWFYRAPGDFHWWIIWYSNCHRGHELGGQSGPNLGIWWILSSCLNI